MLLRRRPAQHRHRKRRGCMLHPLPRQTTGRTVGSASSIPSMLSASQHICWLTSRPTLTTFDDCHRVGSLPSAPSGRPCWSANERASERLSGRGAIGGVPTARRQAAGIVRHKGCQPPGHYSGRMTASHLVGEGDLLGILLPISSESSDAHTAIPATSRSLLLVEHRFYGRPAIVFSRLASFSLIGRTDDPSANWRCGCRSSTCLASHAGGDARRRRARTLTPAFATGPTVWESS